MIQIYNYALGSMQSLLYGEFLRLFLQTIDARGGAAPLGLDATRLSELKTQLTAYNDYTQQSQASAFTPLLQAYDQERIQWVNFILGAARNAKYNAAYSDAVKGSLADLQVLPALYKRMQSIGYRERSQAIQGLLVDVEKVDADVRKEVGITANVLAGLKSATARFDQTLQAQYAQKAASTSRAAEMRSAMDTLYAQIVLEVNYNANLPLAADATAEAKDRKAFNEQLATEVNVLLDAFRARAKSVALLNSRTPHPAEADPDASLTPADATPTGTDTPADDTDTDADGDTTGDGDTTTGGMTPTTFTEIDGGESRTVTTVTTTTGVATRKE